MKCFNLCFGLVDITCFPFFKILFITIGPCKFAVIFEGSSGTTTIAKISESSGEVNPKSSTSPSESCKEYFGLTLEENAVNKGFDAIDKEGKKVEIKTRRTPEGKSKVIFRSFEFDYCVYVELNEFYEPIQFLKIEVNELIDNLELNYKRLSVSKIKKIKSCKIL